MKKDPRHENRGKKKTCRTDGCGRAVYAIDRNYCAFCVKALTPSVEKKPKNRFNELNKNLKNEEAGQHILSFLRQTIDMGESSKARLLQGKELKEAKEQYGTSVVFAQGYKRKKEADSKSIQTIYNISAGRLG